MQMNCASGSGVYPSIPNVFKFVNGRTQFPGRKKDRIERS